VRRLRVLLVWAAILTPGLFLAASGAAYLHDGIGEETAFPVTIDLSAVRPLPKSAYADAAEALRPAILYDGQDRVWQAEAALFAGQPSQDLMGRVENGLAHAPASAEGWTVYSAILRPTRPDDAARALEQALSIAPYDYFWAGRRTRLASQMWERLDEDAKNAALREVRFLWEEPYLHDEMTSLLATPGGAKLVTLAFAGQPDTIRAINRWLSARRWQSHAGQY